MSNSRAASRGLLAAGDPQAVVVENPGGISPLLLLGDHAGRAIPAALGNLGLAENDLERHIAWDIGVAGLGVALARRLDAVFVRQSYSRLVIDCNRDPGVWDSIAPESDNSPIPGNQDLTEAARAARVEAIFRPYHAAIAAELDRREGQPTLLVSLHSFTPEMAGVPRPWRFGVLHRNDSPLSKSVLAHLRLSFGDDVGDNQPYAMDGIDFTIPHHADPRGLDYLELEVRQDEIADFARQEAIADRLVPILRHALEEILP
ncbi:putative N-formylglutamate amidohydrolase [Caulobacter ginsengisoli]|uniref:N-formylglutamate amidohydrolase n=1 Tax=Caulobacter ginsengisoli TaxID=400775 RepID=A0ABU0IX38_9CAUL|nr:N-formylglutamate amidohydrolase [Caulobacter ginsengisoli]MDQ0466569.1 putative N-formylglutamate amidohydrolase [Caulobacter ginsengisoli]